uniref:ATP synthase F0 subunit 8 n=1 Tax=Ditylenchus dipsaci TaxID=166011 RepID=A0A915EJD1_9BILA
MNTHLRIKAQSSIPPVETAALFKIIYSLLPLHSIVSILLYLRFVKINKAKSVFKVEMDKQAKLYFEQLDNQWAYQSKV